MLAAARNLGDGGGGMSDLLGRLRAREKTRHDIQAKKDLDSSGLPTMTASALRQAAIDDEGYDTPELNDRLYLHFKGYRKIQNLEPYTSLKALWLGGNGLADIQGIGHLSELRCLYLQQNLIANIVGLEGLNNLVQLDLSQNRIEVAAGLSCLPLLHTLNLGKNTLGDASAVSPLGECPSLTNLDVTNNRLAGAGVLDVLTGLGGLISLSLAGNPVLSETQHFRKTVITAAPNLRYLDRPVFEAERVAAKAWTIGGPEAEREARTKYQEDRRNEDRRQMQIFRDWQVEQRQKKTAELESRRIAGLGDPTPTPEELDREQERLAQAKADAEEDRRLIKEVGVCKIADAFLAADKNSTCRDALETLAAAAAATSAAEQAEEKMSSSFAGVPPTPPGRSKHGVGGVPGQGDGGSVPPPPPPTLGGADGRNFDDRIHCVDVCSANTGSDRRSSNITVSKNGGSSSVNRSASTSGHSPAAKNINITLADDANGPAHYNNNNNNITTSSFKFVRSTCAKNNDVAKNGESKDGEREQKNEKCGPNPGEPQEQEHNGDNGTCKNNNCNNGSEENPHKSFEDKDETDRNNINDTEDNEEEIRRVRVARSIAMYRAQLAAEHRQEHVTTAKQASFGEAETNSQVSSCSVTDPPSTSYLSDDKASTTPAAVSGARRIPGNFQPQLPEVAAEPAEGSKSMRQKRTHSALVQFMSGHQWVQDDDHRLVQLVRECDFEFERVAERISSQSRLETTAVGTAGYNVSSERTHASILVTAEECRIRFAALDELNMGSAGHEESKGQEEDDEEEEGRKKNDEDENADMEDDTNRVRCSSPGGPRHTPGMMPGVFENAGLSFDELERKSRHAVSRFLEHPTVLPSTKDEDDSASNEEDDGHGGDSVDQGGYGIKNGGDCGRQTAAMIVTRVTEATSNRAAARGHDREPTPGRDCTSEVVTRAQIMAQQQRSAVEAKSGGGLTIGCNVPAAAETLRVQNQLEELD